MDRDPGKSLSRRLRQVQNVIRYWLPLIVYSGGVLYLSTRPGDSLPSLPFSDKLLHFVEYFGLGALFLRFWREAGLAPSSRFLACLASLVAFAFLDESVQGFTAGRTVEWADGGFDVMGGMTGALSYDWIKRKLS